jgi:AcrR family transcriptional regulator
MLFGHEHRTRNSAVDRIFHIEARQASMRHELSLVGTNSLAARKAARYSDSKVLLMAAKKQRKTKPITPRRRPSQARARSKVEYLLQAAAQVFRAEGYSATTNRIAERAGVSIGTLYEYFPNKEALLLALAERHVTEAERGIGAALEHKQAAQLLPALQQAVLASHRYPSTALTFIADPRDQARLKRRVTALRQQILDTLTKCAKAAGLPQPKLRARTAYGLIAELTSATQYEPEYEATHPELAQHLLQLALTDLRAG